MTFIDLRDRYGITQLVVDAHAAQDIQDIASSLGREWVLAKIHAVTMDLKNYTSSPDFFTAVRNEIGNELEKALNK